VKTIFDGTFLPTQQLPTKYQIEDDTIAVLNIYNLSPHWIYFSLSGGIPDIFLPSNYSVEGVSLERLTGMSSLSVGKNKGFIQSIKLTKIGTTSGNTNTLGYLQIQGFRKDENWQGVRPIVTGSLTPVSGYSVANAIVNQGNNPNTPIITANSNVVNGGSVSMDNSGNFADRVPGFAGIVGEASAISVVNGGSPQIATIGQYGGVLAALLQTMLNGQLPRLYSDAGNLTSDASGALTMTKFSSDGVNIVTDGNGRFFTLELIGKILNSSSPIVLNTGDTIATNLASANIVAPAAAVTGIRMQVATAIDGQIFTVMNNGAAASTITFATAGTSHVAQGTSAVIAGQTSRVFVYNLTLNLWF
jgi:hypothetical protein